MTDTLKPGSREALDAGCQCPVLDNHHGRGSGRVNDDGTPAYWINGECPIHGRQLGYEIRKAEEVG